MPRLKQALVEFEDVECAQALVSAAQVLYGVCIGLKLVGKDYKEVKLIVM